MARNLKIWQLLDLWKPSFIYSTGWPQKVWWNTINVKYCPMKIKHIIRSCEFSVHEMNHQLTISAIQGVIGWSDWRNRLIQPLTFSHSKLQTKQKNNNRKLKMFKVVFQWYYHLDINHQFNKYLSIDVVSKMSNYLIFN